MYEHVFVGLFVSWNSYTHKQNICNVIEVSYSRYNEPIGSKIHFVITVNCSSYLAYYEAMTYIVQRILLGNSKLICYSVKGRSNDT